MIRVTGDGLAACSECQWFSQNLTGASAQRMAYLHNEKVHDGKAVISDHRLSTPYKKRG